MVAVACLKANDNTEVAMEWT